MSAQPTSPAAPFLEVVSTVASPTADTNDAALSELARELETQRSASKAMIAAVKELDRRLGEQRALASELDERCRAAEAQVVDYASKLTMQVSDNQRLRRESRAADRRLIANVDMPAWRRLFGR